MEFNLNKDFIPKIVLLKVDSPITHPSLINKFTPNFFKKIDPNRLTPRISTPNKTKILNFTKLEGQLTCYKISLQYLQRIKLPIRTLHRTLSKL